MGTPVSPSVSNIFMGLFETKALDTYPLKPAAWHFVDDIYCVKDKKSWSKILDLLNSQKACIHFTMEMVEAGT